MAGMAAKMNKRKHRTDKIDCLKMLLLRISSPFKLLIVQNNII